MRSRSLSRLNRNHVFNMRLSEIDLRILDDLSIKANMTRSEYVRKLILKEHLKNENK